MPSRHNLLWLKCGPLLAINKCNQRGRYNRTKSNQSNPFKLRASSAPPPHAHAHPLARWVTLAPAAAKPPRVFVRAPTMRAADSRADCTVLYCPSVAHRSRGEAMFLTSTTVNRCFWHGQPTNNVFDFGIPPNDVFDICSHRNMFLTSVYHQMMFLTWSFYKPIASQIFSHKPQVGRWIRVWLDDFKKLYSGDWSCVNLLSILYCF